MNSFDEPLNTPLRQTLDQLLKQTDARVKKTYGPLGALGMAITTAAWATQRKLGRAFGFSSEGRPSEPQMLLQYELLYFFSHLALRTVVAEGFTEPQIKKLQAFLGPLIASTAVDAFCMHWPEHLKRKMRGEIYERLNDAEMEYAECTSGLLEPEDPLNGDTLIGKLAANVMSLWDRAPDDPAAFDVAAAITEALVAMEFRQHVRDVSQVIDVVDVELVKEFWKRSSGA
jgi:hypothetical protein